MSSRPRRIAAVDIGTNSVHMIVAELRKRDYRVVDKEKEMVQLGLGSLDGAPLNEDAMNRAITALKRMAAVARGWDVDEIVAVATSAVREAPNRREFIRRVRDEAEIRVRVISGEEEADYIYRAVRSAVDLDGSTALCIDVGGGSVEFIVGTSSEIYFTASEPLGALRLAQRFRLDDLPVPSDIEACRAFIGQHLRRVQKHVNPIGVDCAIGTSGTIQALAALIAHDPQPRSGLRTLTREALERIVREMAVMPADERVHKLGLDEKRARNIVAGGLVVCESLTTFDLPSILACPVAIREGIIEAARSGKRSEKDNGSSIRRKSVLALADRSACDRRHAQHVARLARRIFNQTRELHRLGDEAGELLELAAILHESGMHVSDRGYHKHTYYLIRHADLRGFTEEQLLVVANVARYHRKAPPADDHPNLIELNDEQRDEVEKLAAILRIAEGLDRSHRQSVRDVAVRANGHVRFFVRARADAAMEIASAEKRAKYFAELFEKKVRFEAS
ncbi:MAG TPA: Ppx/GppA phosphatase family protein [Thermoanaerobaculia bacterium]|nr:Ppx/GppA phosphatase family protein [Thermoanaerobaculia bacterium]